MVSKPTRTYRIIKLYTIYRMGKNRVQRKTKEKNKPRKDNIYTQKHIRIALMKQEKHFEKMGGKIKGKI
jgi:hypothetical protein